METNIKNTLEVVTFGAALTTAILTAREDGKIDANDLANFVAVVPLIGPALEGIGEVPTELSDLNEVEQEEIIDDVKSIVGDVSDEKAVAYATAALKIASGIYDAVKISRG